jgi:hypothetical protein
VSVGNRQRTLKAKLVAGSSPETESSPEADGPSEIKREEQIPATLADLRRLNGLRIIGPDADESLGLVSRLASALQTAYAMGTPRTELLVGLVQINMLQAMFYNMNLIGLAATEMADDAVSPFCLSGTSQPLRSEMSFPKTLVPTALQRSVVHHPWIDILPIPNLRNNLIKFQDSMDEEELCHDLCSYQHLRDEVAGVIVWRDPWDPSGWEVTTAFLLRWGWVMKDCWDLFDSTNYWRAKRGEKPLSRKAWAVACWEVL